MSSSPLPASFTSLYRLFLRTVSASVLHHNPGARNLRQLWRPAFVDAAKVIKQLRDIPDNSASREDLQRWLNTWNQRMDHTLSLLYTSANSRGLPHQLTRNLSILVYTEFERRSDPRTLPVWNPSLPAQSPEYRIDQPIENEKLKAKEKNRVRWKSIDDRAWSSLGHVVKMAEGRDGLSLGRMKIQGRIPS